MSFMTRVFFYRVRYATSGIFRRETRTICCHLLQPLRVLHQLADVAREQFTGEIRLLQKDCGTSVSVDLCVARLVIIRGVWKWNQDAGQRKGGELGQAGGSCSRNDNICGAVHFLHLMMKRTDVSRDIFAAIVV